jgi:hypothetical protein
MAPHFAAPPAAHTIAPDPADTHTVMNIYLTSADVFSAQRWITPDYREVQCVSNE